LKFAPVCLFLVAATAALAAPPSGVVTTIAGNPGIPGYWDGPATDAMFTHPTWLDVSAAPQSPTCDGKGNQIFVVDRMNGLVRRIDETGFVTTFPAPLPAHLDFSGAFAGGVLVEQPGDGCGCGPYARGVFLSSTASGQVVLASPSGGLAARDDWSTVMSGFVRPVGIARSKNTEGPFGPTTLKRKVYVADSGDHTIRQIGWVLSFEACPQGRNVSVLAGNPGHPGYADGIGGAALFDTPRGVATAPDGSVYVSDAGNQVIRKITPDGVVTTVAGTPGVAGSDDTHLNTPSGIDVNDEGEVFFVDTFNHAIRMIGTDGKLVTVAGQLGVSGFADGDAAAAKFNAPVGLKVAPDGTIVIADTGNNVIRRLTLTR
jgi:sugar lactone lactonase YvrE